jgi:hypothetical protein
MENKKILLISYGSIEKGTQKKLINRGDIGD